MKTLDQWWVDGGWCDEIVLPDEAPAVDVARARLRQVTHHKHRELPVDGLLEALRQLARTLGRTPSRSDLTEAGLSHMAYVRRFGSLSQAQEAAGLSANPVGRPRA